MWSNILRVLSEAIWGNAMIGLFVITSIILVIMMVANRRFRGGCKTGERSHPEESKGRSDLTQRQAVATALAAAMGTGNITGVASALIIGGPGAIFWMWIAAAVGMVLAFCENVAGICYQSDGKNGIKVLGTMAVWQEGLKRRKIGILYGVLCILVSVGMGGMAQSRSLGDIMQMQNKVPWQWITLLILIVISVIIFLGVKRVVKCTEYIIPIISVLYIIVSVCVIWKNRENLVGSLNQIFGSALGLNAAVGGVVGEGVRRAISVGCRRGIFSNEAGLGTSAIVHGLAGGNPIKQGKWAAAEVFFDTIVCCSVTALAILTANPYFGASGVNTGSDSAWNELIVNTFYTVLGGYAVPFLIIAISLFAISTILGWSVYGAKAYSYVLGGRLRWGYPIIFIISLYLGATIEFSTVWYICDIFNGLLAIPNLMSLIFVSKEIGIFVNRFRSCTNVENRV